MDVVVRILAPMRNSTSTLPRKLSADVRRCYSHLNQADHIPHRTANSSYCSARYWRTTLPMTVACDRRP